MQSMQNTVVGTVQLGRNSEVAVFQEIAAAKKTTLLRIYETNFAVLPGG